MSISDIQQINDFVADAFIRDLANPQPVPVIAPAELPRTQKFMFRTRPGTTRNAQIRIPVLSNQARFGTDEARVRQNIKAYERRTTPEQRAEYEDLVARIGGLYIKFTPVPRKQECYYETDDPVVAGFLREHVKKQTVKGLYEDFGTRHLRSLYTDAIFPNTETGRAALAAHDLAIEQEMATAKD